jgi:large repetitive protein
MPRTRVLVVPAVAVVVSVAILVSMAGPVSARRQGAPVARQAAKHFASKVKVAKYGLSCTGFTGSFTFTPPLTQTPSFQNEKAALSGSLSGCSTVPPAGGTPVTISGGTIGGTLTIKPTSQGITCGAILAGLANGGGSLALTGKLSAFWTSSPGISPAKSTISVKSAAAPTSGNSHVAQTYTIPGHRPSTMSGAFAGTKSGSLLAVVSGLTPNQEGVACVPSISGGNGLQTLPLASGLLDRGAPPTSITVTPANATISFRQCYTAMGTFPGGTSDLSALASWSVANPSVATIESSGINDGGCVSVSGVSNGTTTIFASFKGTTGSTGVTVARPVSVTTTSLADGTSGSSYDQTLTAADGTPPYTWSISFGSLPPWALLNPSTGHITGNIPATGATGTTSFTVQVTDSSTPTPQSASANLSITVH